MLEHSYLSFSDHPRDEFGVEFSAFMKCLGFGCFCEKHRKVSMKDCYFFLVYIFIIGENFVNN
jgi:hypothetical protein